MGSGKARIYHIQIILHHQHRDSIQREKELRRTMDGLMGLLRVRVKRGIDLAVRDISTSDPYIIIKFGSQTLKTRVIKKDINPVWNEDLTLSVSDPIGPVTLTVYDYDMFSRDDKMGEAEFDIKPFLHALKIDTDGLPSGTVLSRIQPSRDNCLADESCITWKDGKITHEMFLRLKNVESGEVELQLQWIDLPGSRGISSW